MEKPNGAVGSIWPTGSATEICLGSVPDDTAVEYAERAAKAGTRQ